MKLSVNKKLTASLLSPPLYPDKRVGTGCRVRRQDVTETGSGAVAGAHVVHA